MKRRVVDAKRCIKGWFNALAINSSHAFLALLVFLAGVRAMFFPSQLATNSLAILLPHWAFIPWSLLLIAGGALIFFGVATRFPALERSGIISVLGAGANLCFSDFSHRDISAFHLGNLLCGIDTKIHRTSKD